MDYYGGYNKSHRISDWAVAILGALALVVLAGAVINLITAIPVYFLWNWLMPSIFGIKAISYWQAWGLSLLTTILVKGGSSTKTKSSKD